MAGLVTYALNKKESRRIFNQQQLERVYMSFLESVSELSDGWSYIANCTDGHHQFDDIRNTYIRHQDQSDVKFSEAEMIVSLYLPSLKESIDELLQVRYKCGRLIGTILDKNSHESFDIQSMSENVNLIEKELAVISMHFKVKARRIARRLNSERKTSPSGWLKDGE